MGFWSLASLVVVALAAGTVFLMVRDDAAVRPRVPRPDWLVPTPRDIREPAFGFVLQGYDPAEVDALLDATAIAYEELLLAAGPSAVARAEARIAQRTGREHEVSAPSEPVEPAKPHKPGYGYGGED